MVCLDEGGCGRRHLRLIAPPASLAPWVEHLWIQEDHGNALGQPWRIVADFCGHLVFSHGLPDRVRCAVVGSRAIYEDIDVSRRKITAGARLRLGALAPLTRSHAGAFADRAFRVDDVFGQAGRALADRMSNATPMAAIAHLVAFLEEQLSSREPDFQLERAFEAAHSVAWLARSLNVSLRAVQTRTAESVGLSPRRVLRILRLHRALHHASTADSAWAETACIAGFADQSHMVREFRSLLGDSPTGWRNRAGTDSFNTSALSTR